MTFPASERVVYDSHTLNQVIFQVRYPTILSIGESPTAFQNRIREEYPLYQRQQLPQIPAQLMDLVANLPISSPASVAHTFSTADEARSVTLAPDFLAVTENRYDEWPTLKPQIKAVKGALEAIYEPAFYSRVGLRYQDVVDREAVGGSGIDGGDKLLNPTFTGLLSAQEPAIRDSVTELFTNALVALDSVDAAVVRIQHGLARTSTESPWAYLIDADYYTDQRTRERGCPWNTR